MAIRKTILNSKTGKEESGTVVDIVEASEPIIKALLEDGTALRVKLSISEVVKMDEPDPEGNSVYTMNVNMSMNTYPKEGGK